MSGFRIEQVRGGYVIVDADGMRRSGVYADLDRAQTRQESLERHARPIRRPCLCCQDIFYSEGPHNRLCNRCRHKSDVRDMKVHI